jgi:LPXTG-site transpeptidase (sortase) family protein
MYKNHKTLWMSATVFLFALIVVLPLYYTLAVKEKNGVGGENGQKEADVLLTSTVLQQPVDNKNPQNNPNGEALPDSKLTPAKEDSQPAGKTESSEINKIPDPVGINIPGIAVKAPIVLTALDEKKQMQVPKSADQAGWYKKGPKPGGEGAAIIVGHYDSARGPGVFYDLRKLKQGEVIEVTRNDGSVAVYKVRKLEVYPQSKDFPWNEVYSKKGDSSLRLITCHGTFNRQTKLYDKNLVVFADFSHTIKTVFEPRT